jgi:hypothetical protein
MKRAGHRLLTSDARHLKTAIGILRFILHETASAEREGVDGRKGLRGCLSNWS